MSHPVILC